MAATPPNVPAHLVQDPTTVAQLTQLTQGAYGDLAAVVSHGAAGGTGGYSNSVQAFHYPPTSSHPFSTGMSGTCGYYQSRNRQYIYPGLFRC